MSKYVPVTLYIDDTYDKEAKTELIKLFTEHEMVLALTTTNCSAEYVARGDTAPVLLVAVIQRKGYKVDVLGLPNIIIDAARKLAAFNTQKLIDNITKASKAEEN